VLASARSAVCAIALREVASPLAGLAVGEVDCALGGEGRAVSTLAAGLAAGRDWALSSFLGLGATAAGVSTGLLLVTTGSRFTSSRTGLAVTGFGVGRATTAGFSTGRTSR
jgi:hypothetical protein